MPSSYLSRLLQLLLFFLLIRKKLSVAYKKNRRASCCRKKLVARLSPMARLLGRTKLLTRSRTQSLTLKASAKEFAVMVSCRPDHSLPRSKRRLFQRRRSESGCRCGAICSSGLSRIEVEYVEVPPPVGTALRSGIPAKWSASSMPRARCPRIEVGNAVSHLRINAGLPQSSRSLTTENGRDGRFADQATAAIKNLTLASDCRCAARLRTGSPGHFQSYDLSINREADGRFQSTADIGRRLLESAGSPKQPLTNLQSSEGFALVAKTISDRAERNRSSE